MVFYMVNKSSARCNTSSLGKLPQCCCIMHESFPSALIQDCLLWPLSPDLCCSHYLTRNKSLSSKELDVYIRIVYKSLQAGLDCLICYCSINQWHQTLQQLSDRELDIRNLHVHPIVCSHPVQLLGNGSQIMPWPSTLLALISCAKT